MEKVSVVIPTKNRYGRLCKVLRSLEGQEKVRVEVVVVCDDDLETYNKLMLGKSSWKLDLKIILTEQNIEWVAGIKLGIENASNGLVFYGADDIIFYENSLCDAAECFKKNFKDGVGLVKVDDLLNKRVATHALTSKKTIKLFDGFSKAYVHFYADTELTLRAVRENKFTECKEAVVEHVHWVNKKVPKDKTYVDVEKWLSQDKETYLNRNNPTKLL